MYFAAYRVQHYLLQSKERSELQCFKQQLLELSTFFKTKFNILLTSYWTLGYIWLIFIAYRRAALLPVCTIFAFDSLEFSAPGVKINTASYRVKKKTEKKNSLKPIFLKISWFLRGNTVSTNRSCISLNQLSCDWQFRGFNIAAYYHKRNVDIRKCGLIRVEKGQIAHGHSNSQQALEEMFVLPKRFPNSMTETCISENPSCNHLVHKRSSHLTRDQKQQHEI